MKIEIFKNKKSFRRKGGFHINPDICWEFVLYIAFAIVLASVIFSIYLFMQIKKEFVIPTVESGGEIKIVKKERIIQVLEYFSLRETKSAEILNSPSPIVDPSR